MKFLPTVILLALFIVPCIADAQNDSIHLVCPLEDATLIPPPKNVIRYDPPDMCIALSSGPDTIVKACISGTVTNVEADPDEEGKWEVVFFCKFHNKEYYFWYSGLARTTLRRNDEIKAGQAIGSIEKGGKIELLMFDFETQVDPIHYLNCQRVLKN